MCDTISSESRRTEPWSMADLRVLSALDHRAALKKLSARDLNFDPLALPRLRHESGWHVDHYRVCLPPEPPGEPSAGGSWSVARELSAAYEFVDPALVRAYYDPREPFEGRTMLLEVRFWGLRIYTGVRVGGDHDGYRVEGRREARIWVWNYRTLAGHFERGQIDYEVRKWLDNGDVEFRIDAVSRRTTAGHPLVDLGFMFFGKSRQRRFARNACTRMAHITQAVLDGSVGLPPTQRDGDLASCPGRPHSFRVKKPRFHVRRST